MNDGEMAYFALGEKEAEEVNAAVVALYQLCQKHDLPLVVEVMTAHEENSQLCTHAIHTRNGMMPAYMTMAVHILKRDIYEGTPAPMEQAAEMSKAVAAHLIAKGTAAIARTTTH